VNGLIAADAARMAVVLAGFFAGALLGLVHFGSLWWNVQLYAGGRPIRSFGLQILRFALIATVLTGLARLGALPLLAGALGLLLARGILLRRLGRVS